MASSSAGPAAICGNSVIEPGEGCEDENTTDGDGCTGCQQDTGWTCSGLPSVCVTTCGDGIRAGMEECDDHNTMTDDGCDSQCHQQYLQEVEPDESFDDAIRNGPIIPGYVYEGSVEHTNYVADFWMMHIERTSQIRLQVSDTRDFDAPGCIANDPAIDIYTLGTSWVAGDADSGPGECAEVSNLVRWAKQVPPGDYIILVYSEFSTSTIPYYAMKLSIITECGDGVKQQYEQCDGTPDCDQFCRFIPHCGNGRIEQGEQCDDGDLDPTDGCSDMCVIDPAFRCFGAVCQRVETNCNDGLDDDNDGRADLMDADCVAFGDMAPCAPGQKMIALTSRDTPKDTVDNGITTSTLPVDMPSLGAIRRAAVRLNISHRRTPTVALTLRSPSGTVQDLVRDRGMIDSDGWINTLLDDSCANPVSSGASPFAGCYRPEQPLSGFNGQMPQGNWTLTVDDHAPYHTGSIAAWTLVMCTD